MATKSMTKNKFPLRYKVGDPVWARMDGYPWWPARVVTRNDVVVDNRDEEPVVDENSHLVEFFNDNKRFAVMSRRSLRPFNEEHLQINKTYSGSYFSALNVAIREAKDYCAENGLECGSERGASNRKKKEAVNDHLVNSANMKDEPGESLDLEENAETEEERAKKKRKKEKQTTEKVKKKKKEKKEDGEDSAQKKRKRRTEDSQDDEGTVLVVGKKKSVQSHDKSAPTVDLPDVSVLRKSKRRKSEPLEEEEGRDKKGKKAAKVVDKASGEHTHNEKNGKRERADQAKKGEVVRATKRREGSKDADERRGGESDKKNLDSKETILRKNELEREAERHGEVSDLRDAKVTSERREGKRRKEVKSEGKPEPLDHSASVSKTLDDRMFQDGEMYRMLSREQLVELLKAYEKQNRSLRLQVWQLRLQSVDKSKIVTTMEEFIRKCAPGISSVHNMIISYEREQDMKQDTEATQAEEEKRRMEREREMARAEEHVCEQIELLMHVYFEPSIMKKDPKILLRAMKLATKILPHSLKIGRVMKELIVQWVDMVAIENMTSEESGNERKSVRGSKDWSKDKTDDKEDEDDKEGSEEVEESHGDEGDLDEMEAERAERTNWKGDMTEESREEGTDINSKEKVEKGKERKNEDRWEEKSEERLKEKNEDRREEKNGDNEGKMGDVREREENEEAEGRTGKENNTEDNKEDEVDRDKEKRRTERRESDEGMKSLQEEDKDKSSAKSEQRVVDFTRERCTDTFNCMLKPLVGKKIAGIEMTELKVEELAEDLERAVEPRRDDDMKKYFDVSKKVLKLLNGSKEARDAALHVVVKRNAKEFVQKCVEGAFVKDKAPE